MVASWPGRGWHALARPALARLRARRWPIGGGVPGGGQRPWWKWLLVALLLAACITVTVLYAATVAGDVWRQHWAAAVDASREGVLAVVCWAAVIIVLSAGSRSAHRSASQPDGALPAEQDSENSAEADSLRRAQFRVHKLRARLAELDAARDRAGSAADPDLDREVASTVARLERARQWLSSAQAAVAARRHQGQRAAGRLLVLESADRAESQQRAQDLLGRVGRDAGGNDVRVCLVEIAETYATGRDRDVVCRLV